MAEDPNSILNVNVGLLGHVDSGKTSLARALSTIGSTAAFDKNPQSKERGITLDLGFSAVTVDASQAEKLVDGGPWQKVQFTLVDCPGHASLIRTVLGGAQIIDMMVLVVDVTKGMQAQTGEGLVIGQILSPNLMVVLNKVDALPESIREESVAKMTARVGRVLEKATRFRDVPVVSVSATSGDVDVVLKTIIATAPIPKRVREGPALFSIDHCFAIRGQGTVLTGTMLAGALSIGDELELPELGVTKKVKSMQKFRTAVEVVGQGDRVGVCVAGLDAKLVERGLAATPGTVKAVQRAVVPVTRVPHFKGTVSSGEKFHFTVGHVTVTGSATFFTSPDGSWDRESEYEFLEELAQGSVGAETRAGAVLELERPIYAPKDAKLVGFRLDSAEEGGCRIAIEGRLEHVLEKGEGLDVVRVFRHRQKEAIVDRIVDDSTLIGRGLFAREADLNKFVGLRLVRDPGGEEGVLDSPFGKSDKFKVRFSPGALSEGDGTGKGMKGKLLLKYKRFLWDKSKSIVQ